MNILAAPMCLLGRASLAARPWVWFTPNQGFALGPLVYSRYAGTETQTECLYCKIPGWQNGGSLRCEIRASGKDVLHRRPPMPTARYAMSWCGTALPMPRKTISSCTGPADTAIAAFPFLSGRGWSAPCSRRIRISTPGINSLTMAGRRHAGASDPRPSTYLTHHGRASVCARYAVAGAPTDPRASSLHRCQFSSRSVHAGLCFSINSIFQTRFQRLRFVSRRMAST